MDLCHSPQSVIAATCCCERKIFWAKIRQDLARNSTSVCPANSLLIYLTSYIVASSYNRKTRWSDKGMAVFYLTSLAGVGVIHFPFPSLYVATKSTDSIKVSFCQQRGIFVWPTKWQKSPQHRDMKRLGSEISKKIVSAKNDVQLDLFDVAKKALYECLPGVLEKKIKWS